MSWKPVEWWQHWPCVLTSTAAASCRTRAHRRSVLWSKMNGRISFSRSSRFEKGLILSSRRSWEKLILTTEQIWLLNFKPWSNITPRLVSSGFRKEASLLQQHSALMSCQSKYIPFFRMFFSHLFMSLTQPVTVLTPVLLYYWATNPVLPHLNSKCFYHSSNAKV